MKYIIVAICFLLISGCAVVGGGSQSWKEQVILPDGRELLVERSHTLGSKYDREIAAFNSRLGPTSYAVIVPLPGGRTAPWKAEHTDMIPLAVAVEGDTAYLIASPFDCRSYVKWGKPVPPFVVFRSAHGQWRRTDMNQWPTGIAEANLLIDTSDAVVDKGLVTARTIRRINETTILRKIYREGMEKYLWGICLADLKAGRYADVQVNGGN